MGFGKSRRMDVTSALARLGGVSPLAPLVSATSRKKVRVAVARGDVVKVGRDRYALPGGSRAVASARRLDGHLSHLTAALHHGWEVWRQPELPQLVVAPGTPRPADVAADVAVFRVPRADRDGWATGKVLTVLLCARDLPFVEALAVADSALRHRDVTEDELLAAAAAWPEDTIRDRIIRVVRFADARAANPFESALRAIAIEEGLSVVPQYEVRVLALVVHPDLADPLRGIVVEAESWEFHASDPERFARDCVRYSLLTAAGWCVLRFTWDQVTCSEAFVRQVIRLTLEELTARAA